MSSQNLGQYQLDLTGTNPDNFVDNESHTLVRQRNRAIALAHGAFFANSLVIRHVESNYILQQHIDYKILQPYSTLIAATGKSVAGIILIHNSNTHQNLAISYQTVGSDYGTDSKELENYLNSISDQGTTFSWYNSLLEDQSFEGDAIKLDNFDFHWLCYTLEKVRNAIIWSDSEYYNKIRQYLDSVMESIEIQTELALDHYLSVQFESFKTTVTKFTIGLGNVNNVNTASTNEIIQASLPDTRITDFQQNKYVTLQSLAVFKEQLYEKFASSKSTNIGGNRGVAIHPTIDTVLNMVNGAIYLLESKRTNTDSGLSYESGIYPPQSGIDESYTILKVTNNTSNNGGLYLYSERSGKSIYLVSHANGNPNAAFSWNRLTTKEDTASISSDISDHLLDMNNPHGTTKEVVGYFNLENLPVVSSDKIMSLQACREYVTMDGLLLFTKTYLVDKTAAALDPRNDDRDAVQIIYTAQAEDKCLPPDCPCPETPEVTPPPPPPVEPPVVSTLLVKLNQFVNSILKPNIEVSPYTTYNDYFNTVNTDYPAFSVVGEYGYSNGSGTYSQKFLQLISTESLCAGFHPGDIYARVRNQNYQMLTPGIVGAHFDPGIGMEVVLQIEPDELYANREYVASIKMPGRVIHHIRGVFDSNGESYLPLEYFGFEGHHTGSDYATQDAPYIVTAAPYNNYSDRRLNATQSDLDGSKSISFCRAGIYPDYYATVPLVGYVTLDNHSPESGNIIANITIYNIPMYYNSEIDAYIVGPGPGFQVGFQQYDDGIDGVGWTIPSSSFSVQDGDEVDTSAIETYGFGSYNTTFGFPLTSLLTGNNIIRMYIDDGINRTYGHWMLINKRNTYTIQSKQIPVFVDGVQEGTMDISRYSNDQKLVMQPFKTKLDYGTSILSNVYFFEKDVAEGEDPHVYIADIYREETEFNLIKDGDLNSYLRLGTVNLGSSTTFENISLSEYKQIIRNLDNYKKNYQSVENAKFYKAKNPKTITETDFDLITKVRVVQYVDPAYVCTIPPQLLPPVDEEQVES